MSRKAPSYPPSKQFRPDGTPNPNYRPGSVKPEPPPAPPKPVFPPIVTYTKGKGLPKR